jgi:16S rRNA (uracil1498-N3)-methyltransferase
LIGLDGRGARQRLRVQEVGKHGLELAPDAPPEHEPAPGEEGSALPWVEIATAWPRRNRVDDMLSRLVQLGAAAIRALAARQGGPEQTSPAALRRWSRVAREACKQSGRAWLPLFQPALSPEGLAKAHPRSVIAVLDPLAGLALDTWLRSFGPSPAGLGTKERPIVIVVGPEGGLASDERDALLVAGAAPTWLGPHVLRVETAAEAAMAVTAVVHGKVPAP